MLDTIIQNMNDAGFYPRDINPDGRIHRFGREPKDRDKNCWYFCTAFNARTGEQHFVCVWGDWSEPDTQHKFCTLSTFHNDDRVFVDKQIKKAQKKQEEDTKADQEQAKKEAKAYLHGLPSDLTPYATRKQITSLFGAFNDGELTIVPVVNEKNELQGYQTIFPDGTKRFKLHTAKKGNFFPIGKPSTRVWLVEGFATGATVHMATSDMVLVCFDAGNLTNVKQKFPNSILAGDNDEAGHALAGIFPDTPGNDWNDEMVEHGLQFVTQKLNQEPLEYVRALGYRDDVYYYTSSGNRQIVSLAASGHTENNFYNLMPREYWQANFPSKLGTDFKAAASSLMSQARQRGIFNPKNVRGTGVWLDKELVVNCGKFVHPKMPVMSKYTYVISNPIPSPVFDTDIDTNVLLNILDKLCWRSPDHAKLLAGWLTIAPFSGALAWRPHIWLTGSAGSGKSTVMEHIIHAVLDEYKIYFKSNSTEAGIRQMLGHNALPLIFDEFEQMGDKSDERNKAILDLFRQASFESSGEIIKGSTSGNSIQYSPRFCALVSSIRINLTNDADIARFTVLDLKQPTTEEKKNFHQLEKDFSKLTPEYSLALFGRTYKNFSTLQANIALLFTELSRLFNARFAQQYSALVAGYALLKSDEPCTAEILKEFEFKEMKPQETDSDEYSCLGHLMDSLINVEVGTSGMRHERTVQECVETIMKLADNSENYGVALRRYGLKVSEDGAFLYVAQNNPLLKKLFSNTKWINGWSKSLSRLRKAVNGVTIRIEQKIYKSTKIPMIEILDFEEPPAISRL